jgi:hypothetical protein
MMAFSFGLVGPFRKRVLTTGTRRK